MHKWPFTRGRDRFFRMLSGSMRQGLDNIKNPIPLKNGLKLFVTKEDFLSHWLKCYGQYEPQTSKKIQQYSKPDSIFLDVGANLGIFSLEVAKLFGNQVVSFEPNPKIAKLLQSSIEENKLVDNIHVHNVAVSDENTTAVFVEHPSNKGGSALEVNKDLQTGERYKVNVVALDEYSVFQEFLENSNAQIGLIKMDIEGAEERALKGMAKMLSIHKPIIIMELLDSQLKIFGSSKSSVICYLKSLDYYLHEEFEGNGIFFHKKVASDPQK